MEKDGDEGEKEKKGEEEEEEDEDEEEAVGCHGKRKVRESEPFLSGERYKDEKDKGKEMMKNGNWMEEEEEEKEEEEVRTCCMCVSVSNYLVVILKSTLSGTYLGSYTVG